MLRAGDKGAEAACAGDREGSSGADKGKECDESVESDKGDAGEDRDKGGEEGEEGEGGIAVKRARRAVAHAELARSAGGRTGLVDSPDRSEHGYVHASIQASMLAYVHASKQASMRSRGFVFGVDGFLL